MGGDDEAGSEPPARRRLPARVRVAQVEVSHGTGIAGYRIDPQLLYGDRP